MNWPYIVEYAKSMRAYCGNCHKNIEKDRLRLAVIVQSPVHDGKQRKWYHPQCFFIIQKPQSTADFENFDNIRWNDQKWIETEIEESSKAPAPSTGKGKKRGAAKSTEASRDFLIQYAKSSVSTCEECKKKIVEVEVRVSRKDFESEEGRKYGGIDSRYHLECFAKIRAELQFHEGGDALPGIENLSEEDQQKVKAALPKIKSDDVPPVKKLKDEPMDVEEQNKLRKQNEEFYEIKDVLAKMKKRGLITMLKKNKQQVPVGVSAILDRLSDAMCFGNLEPCEECYGQLVYNSGLGYKCTGNLTKWVKCERVTRNPKRRKHSIPSYLESKYPELASVTCRVRRRLVKVAAPSTSSLIKKEDTVDAGPKVEAAPKPLEHMQFVIIGETKKDKNSLEEEIARLGGKVITGIHERLAAVISTQREIDEMSEKMKEAKDLNIQVITEDFLDEAKDCTTPAIQVIEKKTISSWGGNLSDRINVLAEKSADKSRDRSVYEKPSSGKIKLQLKNGGIVDPDSGLQDISHVYESGGDKYTVTLVDSDIQTNKNSYYKLQILEDDKKSEYWLFRSWGRIETIIGDETTENLSLEECLEKFKSLYEEKTGNLWSQRKHFVKMPNKKYPVDLDHGEKVSIQLLKSDIQSDLEKPVQDLMRLIFDEVNMKKVIAEFEIDTNQMPLGKLSKKQIQKAYSVLTDLHEVLKNGQPDRDRLIHASNKFYNLIPHNFGVSKPKPLETVEEIHLKYKMLDALLEVEIAYSLLHAKMDSTENPLDAHYKQLNTEIKVLEKESEEYKIIEQYVRNTHAGTHTHYELEIEDVFAVKRQGEDSRYEPFRKLPNRKLLWHGSRTTNFAGILSQGLRIAPPEAPVTGYMFGKGVYFADMVSKSANYCCTNSENSTGLLLLCEVALGNMYDRYRADYIEKLPWGKHSTMGHGQTQPDPKCSIKMKDGVEVPYGPPTRVNLPTKSELLYNEYIVYDTAQTKARYLIKTKFRYK